ncbi:MAG: hypothetical protein WCJ19_01140 [bacterium]
MAQQINADEIQNLIDVEMKNKNEYGQSQNSDEHGPGVLPPEILNTKVSSYQE